jgi:hypothetical protein
LSTDEQARAQAEAALKKKGWELWTPGYWWEGELAVGRSADGEHEASLWDRMDGRRNDAPWLCDVGVTPPDSEKKSLWVLGIPGPEEVSALLMKHADLLSVGLGDHVLDLATGEVITEGRLGIAAVIRDAKDRLGGFKRAAHALDTVGWKVQEIRLGCDGFPDTIIAKRR